MSLFARLVLLLSAVEAVGAQTPNLTFSTYSAPTFPGRAGPYGIIAGPDGALWLQGRFDQIGRMTTDGQVAFYPVPHELGWSPGSITAGPDGAVWFTEFGVAKIARITGQGAVTEFDTPAKAGAIAAGPDGALWFSEGNKNGRMTTDGAVTEYPLPDPSRGAGAIAAGLDGALWFVESTVNAGIVNGQTTLNKIGRITTGGVITEYDLPPASWFQGAWFIVAGPDGAMWFNEYYAGKIGRITTGCRGRGRAIGVPGARRVSRRSRQGVPGRRGRPDLDCGWTGRRPVVSRKQRRLRQPYAGQDHNEGSRDGVRCAHADVELQRRHHTRTGRHVVVHRRMDESGHAGRVRAAHGRYFGASFLPASRWSKFRIALKTRK